MTDEKHNEIEASFDGTDLEKLTNHVKGILDIQDRTYGIPPKKYAMCFVGSEAVETFMREEIASDEADALRIGNMMLNAGVFHHVQQAHPFENKYLFYRFASDEDHGKVARKPDGGAVRWADFLSPLTSAGARALYYSRLSRNATRIWPIWPRRTWMLVALHRWMNTTPNSWICCTPKRG